MKKILTYVWLTIFLIGCGQTQATPEVPVEIPTQTQTGFSAPTAIATPTMNPTLVPTPTPLPTEIPPYIGRSYTGYWLKLSKDIGESKSQTLTLYYQDGYELAVIATFCVRAGDNNTPNGFYFIAIDRPTTYPTAHGGYQDTFFSHNLAWKLSFRNWYLHAAPWNTEGIRGCPTNGSGGCVNMRTEDFNLLLTGGEYENPITGEKAVIPEITVGTPFVITDNNEACTYLGTCMEVMSCKTGLECFQRYTCAYCKKDAVSKWEAIALAAPQIKILDTPFP